MRNQPINKTAPWWIVAGFGPCVGCADTPPTPTRLDDAALSCPSPTLHTYRLTAVDPSAWFAGRIDINDDGLADDLLGRAHDEVAAIDPQFAVAPRFGARLASDVPWLLEVTECPGEARVRIDRGIDVDHALMMPPDQPRAVGAISDGALLARDGVASIPLAALADPLAPPASDAGWTLADGLTVRATLHTDGTIDGVFAAAIDTATARTVLAPPLAHFFTAQPASDPFKTGADRDADGTVTPAELASTTAFTQLVDSDLVVLDLAGTPRTGAPASSLAFAFTGSELH